MSQSTANLHTKQPDAMKVNRSEMMVKSFVGAVQKLNILQLPKLKFK